MKDELQKIRNSIIECEPLPTPKCWICKDNGMVYYEKVDQNISYDFAYRCNCKAGQISSDRIPTVPKEFAEKIAIENYRYFSKEFSKI